MNNYSQRLPINGLINGRYRIQDVLGEGGYGISYRAWDEKLERVVVVKEYLPIGMGARTGGSGDISPLPGQEENFRYGLKKYLGEAKTLARFKHAALVRVHDFFEAHGTAYTVMELEEGETLGERLKLRRNRPLSESEILELLVPLLQGLKEVHQAGLLHRNINPDNIFLRQADGPVLFNFSAARQALGDHSKSLSVTLTPGYAPPEQYIQRAKLEPASDLYAIGAMLYELITGQRPNDAMDRSRELMDGRPDPLRPAAEAGRGRQPGWLLGLTDRLLAIRSQQRPQGCDDVLRTISRFRQGREAPPRVEEEEGTDAETRFVTEEDRFTSGETPKRGFPWHLAVAASLLVILLAWWWAGW